MEKNIFECNIVVGISSLCLLSPSKQLKVWISEKYLSEPQWEFFPKGQCKIDCVFKVKFKVWIVRFTCMVPVTSHKWGGIYCSEGSALSIRIDGSRSSPISLLYRRMFGDERCGMFLDSIKKILISFLSFWSLAQKFIINNYNILY